MNLSVQDAPLTMFALPEAKEAPYLGGSRGRAVAALSKGMSERQGPLLLTGAAGVGKSVVLRAALATLAEEPIRVISLSHPGASAWSHRDLAGQILGKSIAAQTDAEELAATISGPGQVVIAVDDAQALTSKALELLLVIASPTRDGGIPPQLVLAGRGDFPDWASGSGLRLVARLADRINLAALFGNDSRDYSAFRLKQLDGRMAEIVTFGALIGILRHSGGLPGKIDQILAAVVSSGVCGAGGVLTGEMVESAIAALASRAAMAPPRRVVPRQEPSGHQAWQPDRSVAPVSFDTLAAASFGFDLSQGPGAAASLARAANGETPKPANEAPPDADEPAAVPGRGLTRAQAARVTAAAAVIVAMAGGFAALRGLPPDRAVRPSASPEGPSSGEPAEAPGPAARMQAVNPTVEEEIAADRQSPDLQARAPATNEATDPLPEKPAETGAVAASTEGPSGTPAEHPAVPDATASADHADDPAIPADPSVAVAKEDVTPETGKDIPAPGPAASEKTSPEASVAEIPMAPPLPRVFRPSEPSAALKDDTENPLVRNSSAETNLAYVMLLSGSLYNSAETLAALVGALPSAAAVRAAEPSPSPARSADPSATRPPATSALSAPPPSAPPASGNASAEPATVAPPPANAVVALATPERSLAAAPEQREVVTPLLRRADDLLRRGDVLAARLFYERAASAGSGQGATGAGKTYDPNFLASIDARGMQGDVARAMEWYRQGSDVLGDKEAGERLKVLAGQTGR